MTGHDDQAAAEAIRAALSADPGMVAELLRLAGVTLPKDATVEAVPVDWEELIPKECQADGVLYLHRGGDLEVAVAVDLQFTADDERARREWPAHLAWLHAECHERAGHIIIAPDPQVARWAAEPIEGGSLYMKPLVLGPDHLHLLPDGARRCLDTLAASGAEPRGFRADDVAELLRHVVGHDDAGGIREFLNGAGHRVPRGLRASFTVKGRGPLRSWRA